MYTFIIKSKIGNYIIDIQKNLTETEVENKINWFIENGYYQMADYLAYKEK